MPYHPSNPRNDKAARRGWTLVGRLLMWSTRYAR